MKAQFATIEAMISLVLVASAMTFVSSQTNSATANFNAQRSMLQRSAALYDIVNALRQNLTANNCLSELYLTNQSGCMQNLTETYAKIFGLSSAEIAGTEGQLQNNTQNTTSSCVSLFLVQANLTSNVCILANSW